MVLNSSKTLLFWEKSKGIHMKGAVYMISFDFTDKIVVVTGAGHGIGEGVARAYASHGATVVLAEKNEENGKRVEVSIRKTGGEARFVQTDVSRPEQIEALMQQVKEWYGRLDIMINNAGVSRWKSPYEITVEEWDNIININLRGMFLGAREAAKIMRENGGGSIVNIASTRAFMSEPDSEAYAASKGGIFALTHALAISFADDRIQVNAISPGWIEVDDYEGLRNIDHAQHPSKRVGKPEDIARACLYLTSADNEFINGQNLIIDGGMTRKMIYKS
jgi:NAD(P)-dependent dehydrogenase (short-subunit alcohol dehydrogenase family)